MFPRKYLSAVVISAVAALASAPAMANSIDFIGSAKNPDDSSSNLMAEADFTVTNGQIVVTLTNNTPVTVSAAELLTQITFSISGGKTVTAETSAIAADLVNINGPKGNPTVVDLGANQSVLTEWQLTSGNTLTWNGSSGPDDGIIGPGPWTSANSSIVGNGPHNPIIVRTATFTLTGSSILATDTISNVNFFFGTGPSSAFIVPVGTTQQGGSQPPVAPLPNAALSGTALLGALAIGAKIRKKFVD